MTHKLIALIVKAANETEAEEKSWSTIERVCSGEGCEDFGFVLESKIYVERAKMTEEDTRRWKIVDESNPRYQETKHIRICQVDSEDAQKLIRTSFPPTDPIQKKELENLKYKIGGMSTLSAPVGYFIRDENYNYMKQDDARLQSKEYFVVPIDIHT